MIKVKGFCVLVAVFLWVGATFAEEGFAPAPEGVRPLLIGQELPALTLTADNGDTFDLNAANSKKPLVVVFYRGHW